MGVISKTVTVETDVDVDISLDDFSEEEIQELVGENEKTDMLNHIYQRVAYEGASLEETIEELMRERDYLWPPATMRRA